MPSVHFPNVSLGDCTIIRHGSGRVSIIDMCNGNIQTGTLNLLKEVASMDSRLKGFRYVQPTYKPYFIFTEIRDIKHFPFCPDAS